MKKITLFLFTLIFITSCNKENTTHFKDESSVKENQSEMVLGKKLENPYSLSNMQKAFNELCLTRSIDTTTLKPTDLYVRFLPADTSELYSLQNIGLELFCYPLDYDIEKDGSTYHDPSVPVDAITWQYTTVKPDFKFPNVKYEILEECYIPDEEDVLTRSGESGSFFEELEQLAFKKAGLLNKFSDFETKGLFGKSYRPSGKITVWDTKMEKLVPVKGVKIRCHVVVKWSTSYTREDGTYTMGSKFSLDPHYAIVFENMKGFTIWGNWGFLAAANYHMGWHNKKGYSKEIYTESVAWVWANVNNSGYEYYQMCEKEGISKPPLDLKIWSFKHEKASSASMMRRVWQPMGINSNSFWLTFFTNSVAYPKTQLYGALTKGAQPDITIGSGGGHFSDKIHEHVFHELSHASHFQQVGASYWADYIKYIITYGAYGDGTGKNAGICEVGEMWGYAMGNISIEEKYGIKPKDEVSKWFNYKPIYYLMKDTILTKKEIFNLLSSDVKSHQLLKNKMVNRYPNLIEDINISYAYGDVYKTRSKWTIYNSLEEDITLTLLRNKRPIMSEKIERNSDLDIAIYPDTLKFEDIIYKDKIAPDEIKILNKENKEIHTWIKKRDSIKSNTFFDKSKWSIVIVNNKEFIWTFEVK